MNFEYATEISPSVDIDALMGEPHEGTNPENDETIDDLFIQDTDINSNDEEPERVIPAKKKFDSLGLSLKEDEDIKEWYRGYTDVLQMAVGMAEHNLKDNQERLDSLSKVLVEDYEEDLDLLYELNKY